MAYLSCNNLGKTFRYENTFRNKNTFRDKIIALENFNLEVEAGEFIVVLGPSGCGKSTLLRLIAGLEAPTSGSITLEGQNLQGVSPAKRNVALMFQHYTLFPHLTVYENMAYGLKIKGLPPQQIREKIAEAAKLLSIEDVLDRRPAALSGGQRQRAALGRAVIREPKLFLLDEPLSNLDAQLRNRMRVEIRQLQKRLGITTLYVTHDQTEAMTMGDRIVVLNRGRMEQTGSPDDVYGAPQSLFVAGFMGSPGMNLLPLAAVLSHTATQGGKPASHPFQQTSKQKMGVESLEKRLPDFQKWLDHPETITLGFRPEQAFLVRKEQALPASGKEGAKGDDTEENFINPEALYLPFELTSLENQGARKFWHGKFLEHPICLPCSNDSHAQPGETAMLMVPWVSLHWFDSQSGRRYV